MYALCERGGGVVEDSYEGNSQKESKLELYEGKHGSEGQTPIEEG